MLIWLYVGWLILLTGCQLAFYLQNPGHIRVTRVAPYLASRGAEYIALAIMVQVARAFVKGQPAPTTQALIDDIKGAPEHVHRQLAVLRHHGLLAETAAKGGTWLPGIDPEQVSMVRLWRLVRSGTEPLPRGREPVAGQVLRLLDDAEAPLEATRSSETLRQFVLQDDPPPAIPGA